MSFLFSFKDSDFPNTLAKLLKTFLFVSRTIFCAFFYKIWNHFWPPIQKKKKKKKDKRVLGLTSFWSLFYSFHADRPHNSSLPKITSLGSAKNDLMLQTLWHIPPNLPSYFNLWKSTGSKLSHLLRCVLALVCWTMGV